MRLSSEALKRCEPHFTCLSECIGQINIFARDAFNRQAEKRSYKGETLRALFLYQSDRCLGAYCLLVNGLIWDAEIVLRSVYEAFAKILLIALADPRQSEELLREFWTELSAIYDRRGALKAEKSEEFSKQFASEDARIFAGLRDERLFKVAPTGNKKSRKEIEQRWSFAGIVEAIGKGDFGKFVGIEALSHQYGLASHLSHVSPKAFDLLEDRATRGSNKLLLEVGHTCRICSDIVSLLAFSAHFVTKSEEISDGLAAELKDAFDRMSQSIEADQAAFHSSQDEFYESRGRQSRMDE